MKLLKTVYILKIVCLLAFQGCNDKKQEVRTEITALEEAAPATVAEEVKTDSTSGEKVEGYVEAEVEEYTEAEIVEADDPGNFEHVFAGSLEKKDNTYILISMYLKAENGNLTGKYFYEGTAKREDITLRGNLEGDSLILVEYDPANTITGRFNGKFVLPEEVEGSWSRPDGKRKLPFKMKINNMEYDQRKIIGLKADDYQEVQ